MVNYHLINFFFVFNTIHPIIIVKLMLSKITSKGIHNSYFYIGYITKITKSRMKQKMDFTFRKN